MEWNGALAASVRFDPKLKLVTGIVRADVPPPEFEFAIGSGAVLSISEFAKPDPEKPPEVHTLLKLDSKPQVEFYDGARPSKSVYVAPASGAAPVQQPAPTSPGFNFLAHFKPLDSAVSETGAFGAHAAMDAEEEEEEEEEFEHAEGGGPHHSLGGTSSFGGFPSAPHPDSSKRRGVGVDKDILQMRNDFESRMSRLESVVQQQAQGVKTIADKVDSVSARVVNNEQASIEQAEKLQGFMQQVLSRLPPAAPVPAISPPY